VIAVPSAIPQGAYALVLAGDLMIFVLIGLAFRLLKPRDLVEPSRSRVHPPGGIRRALRSPEIAARVDPGAGGRLPPHRGRARRSPGSFRRTKGPRAAESRWDDGLHGRIAPRRTAGVPARTSGGRAGHRAVRGHRQRRVAAAGAPGGAAVQFHPRRARRPLRSGNVRIAGVARTSVDSTGSTLLVVARTVHGFPSFAGRAGDRLLGQSEGFPGRIA
jgi:hypothetical protein